MSEFGLSATCAADVKAVIWTPPMGVASPPDSQAVAAAAAADARRASWRGMSTSDQLPAAGSVKLSSPELNTEPQRAPLPPPPALMYSLRGSRFSSLYVCAVCGFDAGGYVELARHAMTSHYSAMTSHYSGMTSAAATPPFKRRWDGSDRSEARWTPPPSNLRLDSPLSRPAAVSHLDDRREFLQTGFQAGSTSTPVFHQQPSSAALGWGSYRPLPPPPPPPPAMSTAFGSLNAMRAELDAMRFADPQSRRRAEERTYHQDDVQRDGSRVKSAQSNDLVNAALQWTRPQDFTSHVSQMHQNTTRPPQAERLSASATATVGGSGLPLDLTTSKMSPTPPTPRRDQMLDSAQGGGEVKRSRRKGRAFKVDAERLNSGSELADVDDPVGRYSATTTTQMINSPWRTSSENNLGDVTTDGEPAAARSVRVLGGGREAKLSDDREPVLPTVPRYEEELRRSGCSDTTPTSASGSTTSSRSSTPYHECRHCGLGFRDGELFAMHMDFHGRPDPFTCNFCGAATGNQVEFFLHVAHAPHNVRPVYVV